MTTILIVTDSWKPLINGVVTSLINTIQELENRGYRVVVIDPSIYFTVPLPIYPEIKIPVLIRNIHKTFQKIQPDIVHIATEAFLGLAYRKYCIKNNLKFTTSLHTKFPEYVNKRFPFIPTSFGYKYLKYFHNAASNTLVTTQSMKDSLLDIGFNNMMTWSRGVDFKVFNINDKQMDRPDFRRIKWLYVGRISVEKNIEDFLCLRLPGEKRVVGDGPQMRYLEQKYENPNIKFLGYKKGDELAKEYKDADVMVFPSRTDTFGNVITEAMACGTPVAAYPVTGPKDIIVNGVNGFTDENLYSACVNAYNIMDHENIFNYTKQHYTWEIATDQFIAGLVHIR